MANDEKKFTVLTWNILAPSLATNSPRGFPYVSKDDLETKGRVKKISTFLKKSNADILCLQEVELDVYDQLVLYLGEEYPHFNYYNSSPSTKLHGLAIFSKHSPIDWGEGTLTKRHTQGWLSVLIHPKGYTPIYIVNTHLKAKPEFQKHRTEQIDFLLKLFHAHANYDQFLCGDFNAIPNEKWFQRLLNEENFSWAGGLSFTTAKRRSEDSLTIRISDYILYRGDFVEDEIIQMDNTNIPVNGWPSEEMPSDHSPVMGKFSFLNE